MSSDGSLAGSAPPPAPLAQSLSLEDPAAAQQEPVVLDPVDGGLKSANLPEDVLDRLFYQEFYAGGFTVGAMYSPGGGFLRIHGTWRIYAGGPGGGFTLEDFSYVLTGGRIYAGGFTVGAMY